MRLGATGLRWLSLWRRHAPRQRGTASLFAASHRGGSGENIHTRSVRAAACDLLLGRQGVGRGRYGGYLLVESRRGLSGRSPRDDVPSLPTRSSGRPAFRLNHLGSAGKLFRADAERRTAAFHSLANTLEPEIVTSLTNSKSQPVYDRAAWELPSHVAAAQKYHDGRCEPKRGSRLRGGADAPPLLSSASNNTVAPSLATGSAVAPHGSYTPNPVDTITGMSPMTRRFFHQLDRLIVTGGRIGRPSIMGGLVIRKREGCSDSREEDGTIGGASHHFVPASESNNEKRYWDNDPAAFALRGFTASRSATIDFPEEAADALEAVFTSARYRQWLFAQYVQETAVSTLTKCDAQWSRGSTSRRRAGALQAEREDVDVGGWPTIGEGGGVEADMDGITNGEGAASSQGGSATALVSWPRMNVASNNSIVTGVWDPCRHVTWADHRAALERHRRAVAALKACDENSARLSGASSSQVAADPPLSFSSRWDDARYLRSRWPRCSPSCQGEPNANGSSVVRLAGGSIFVVNLPVCNVARFCIQTIPPLPSASSVDGHGDLGVVAVDVDDDVLGTTRQKIPASQYEKVGVGIVPPQAVTTNGTAATAAPTTPTPSPRPLFDLGSMMHPADGYALDLFGHRLFAGRAIDVAQTTSLTVSDEDDVITGGMSGDGPPPLHAEAKADVRQAQEAAYRRRCVDALGFAIEVDVMFAAGQPSSSRSTTICLSSSVFPT